MRTQRLGSPLPLAFDIDIAFLSGLVSTDTTIRYIIETHKFQRIMPTIQEFTLRNKNSDKPIQTLAASVMKTFLSARPDSVSIVLAKYQKDYASLTGKTVTLDREQQQKLLADLGANEQGHWVSPYSNLSQHLSDVKNCFLDGFMGRPISSVLLSNLAISEQFFDLMDTAFSSVPKTIV